MKNYQYEWETYRQLRRRFLFLWAAYLPVFVVVALISGSFFPKGSANGITVAAVLASVWMLLFLRSSRRLKRWNCPRCHERFAPWWKGVFTDKCANCGLARYSD